MSYQIPVPSIEKIRKTRRKVKTVLSEFGLEECQNLLKELHKDPEVNSEEDDNFEETEWTDFTDGFNGKMKKKWPYRTKAMCCSLCPYSTKNSYCFQSHINRLHKYEKSECTLAVCSQCPFVGPAKTIKRHALFFHNAALLAAPTDPPEAPRQKKPVPLASHRPNERYNCRKCGFPSSSIFPLKKHIILKHLPNLAQQFIGYKTDNHTKLRIYCCRVCKLQTGSLDHVIHHMLVEPAHRAISMQVQGMIQEKKFYVSATTNGFGGYSGFSFIAPKPGQTHVLSNGSLILQPNQQQPGTLMALQQLQGAPPNLICAPGPNQTLLPPQASALVQLASAEAKGLLQPGATLALQGPLAQGSPMVQFPTTAPSTSLKQAMPAAPPVPGPLMHNPPTQPMILPPGPQVNISRGAFPPSQPQKASTNLQTPQGTMMTSQSLLNHLIPTGNKVNGLPIYTFAPVSAASSQSKGTPLAPITSGSNSSVPAAKKWITCPLCNELFPSNVYAIHTEVAHKTKAVTSKCESLAARALFLKKMPDKTVKCLVCKILLSEKGVFEHLLHGLNCVYCSALFFSIKQLVEHVKEHDPTNKANCDFLRQEFRVYTNNAGKIVFPYFDINTSAPMQVIGDTEFHLALITTSFDLIFLKMLPSTHPEECHSALKSSSLYCPFCDEKFVNALEHLQHLKQKHFVAPTIHAILKTEALKCIYCNGVYTGKVTQQAVMLHMQRCRCAPKKQPEPPKAKETVDLQPRGRGRPPGTTKPKPVEQISQPQPQPPPQPQPQPQNLYYIQMPRMSPLIQAPSPALILQPPSVPIPKPPVGPVETEAELESKRRLEAAWKEVVEANRREREERLTMMRKRRELEKRELEKRVSPISSEKPGDSLVKLALEPSPLDTRSTEALREFTGRYFHVSPYISKVETEELCRRLNVTRSELAAHFTNRRRSCMTYIRKKKAVIFMGFNMTELSKVKHNLYIPEVQIADAEPVEQTDMGGHKPEPMEESTNPERTADSEPTEELGEMENTVIDANVDASDKAEERGEA